MIDLDRAGPRGWLERIRFSLVMARPRQYVFVLSHMRSYSSLLCHILNSNPEIAGYVELHQSYRSYLDLVDLRFKVATLNSNRLRGRYVLDKILHSNSDLSREILDRDDVFAIFSIREPEQTVKSTMAMVKRKKRRDVTDWRSDPASYYVRRLDRLAEIAAQKPSRSIFFDADLLIDRPETVLAGLTSFLELKQPLRGEYDVFDLTGRPRFGDPGKFISSGHIVHERRDYSDIEVPEEDLLRAKEAYERTRESLRERCAVSLP